MAEEVVMPVTSCSSCGRPWGRDAVLPRLWRQNLPATSDPPVPSTGGCTNCGSDAVHRVTTGTFGELLQESSKAAAGCGTFVVGLFLLALPVLGALVLGLALLMNLLVLISVVVGAGVALRSRGELGCATCN